MKFKFDSKILKRIERLNNVIEYRALKVNDKPYHLDGEELTSDGVGTVLRFFESSPNPFDLILTTKRNYLIVGLGNKTICNQQGKEIKKVDHKYFTEEDFIEFLKGY